MNPSINSPCSVAGVPGAGQSAGSDQLLDHVLHLLPLFRRLSKHSNSYPAVAMGQERSGRQEPAYETFPDTTTNDNDDDPANYHSRDPRTSGSCQRLTRIFCHRSWRQPLGRQAVEQKGLESSAGLTHCKCRDSLSVRAKKSVK